MNKVQSIEQLSPHVATVSYSEHAGTGSPLFWSTVRTRAAIIASEFWRFPFSPNKCILICVREAVLMPCFPSRVFLFRLISWELKGMWCNAGLFSDYKAEYVPKYSLVGIGISENFCLMYGEVWMHSMPHNYSVSHITSVFTYLLIMTHLQISTPVYHIITLNPSETERLELSTCTCHPLGDHRTHFTHLAGLGDRQERLVLRQSVCVCERGRWYVEYQVTPFDNTTYHASQATESWVSSLQLEGANRLQIGPLTAESNHGTVVHARWWEVTLTFTRWVFLI